MACMASTSPPHIRYLHICDFFCNFARLANKGLLPSFSYFNFRTMNKAFLPLIIIASALTCASACSDRGTKRYFVPVDDDCNCKNQVSDKSFAPVINPGIPQKLTFAGQEFDFDRTDMYERFDRELSSIAYTHGATLLMIKRANKYFPLMAPILEKNGIPLDFLYLACVESSLNPRALSPAKAAGFWQFMPATARQYGLEVNDNVDERYNLEKSTEAACRFLKDAYNRYGNWESVAASYNAGMGRISNELNRQSQDTSFDLHLNEETSRYVFRIFAMKLILENPRNYGFVLKPEQLYYPTPTRDIEVKGPITDLPSWAINNGTSYQWVKELNPWLRTRSLPNRTSRTYKIKVPADSTSLSRRTTTKQPIYNRIFVSE